MASSRYGWELPKRANTDGRGADVVSLSDRDWTSLPMLVLEEVLDRLDCLKDYTRFLIVCKAWADFARTVWPQKKTKYKRLLDQYQVRPMLLVGRHDVYSVATGSVKTNGSSFFSEWLHRRLADSTTRVIGSSFGWLIAYIAHRRIVMFDSQVQEHPQSLPLCGFALAIELDGYHAIKAILSADPSNSDAFELVILARKSLSASLEVTKLVLWRMTRNGRLDRQRVVPYKDHVVLDIACLNGHIFWLEKESSRTTFIEPKGFSIYSASSGKGTRISTVFSDDCLSNGKAPIFSRYNTAYIVEQSAAAGHRGDGPWLVIRYRIMSDEGTIVTVGFKVFESTNWQGNGGSSWRRASKLKNDVILLGCSSALCLAGSGLLAADGLQPNCIYYIDNQENKGDNNGDNNTSVSHDMGVFDVEQDCRRPFPFPEEFKKLLSNIMKLGASVWFTSKLSTPCSQLNTCFVSSIVNFRWHFEYALY